MVVKKDMNSNGHRLLIQKLLVSIHYLTLFRDEIVLVEKTPSLLGASFSPNVVQSELGEILAAVDALSKQEKLIKSTFWYDEASFRLMNHSLDIVGTWVRGIDNVLEICESKSVFHAILGDNRQRVFGVLIDVFTSLRVTNLSIKEESEYPILVDPLQVVEYKKREVKKAELMAKIDALTPRKSEEVYDDSKDEKVESIPELVEKELAKEREAAKSEKVLGPGELKEVVKENDEVADNQEDTEEVLEFVVADEVEPVEEDAPQTEVTTEEVSESVDEEPATEVEVENSDEENEEQAQEELAQSSREETEQEFSEKAEIEEVSDEDEEIEETAELEVEDDLVESEEPETVELEEQADEVVTSDEEQVSDNEVLLDEESEAQESKESDFPVISRDEAIKQFRHFLFDHKGLVCVLDAGDDLKREIKFYNAFDRFYGAVDNISDCLVILENVLDELRRRKKEVFDAEGNLISEPTEPINLLVYGQNILLEDSRFETLMSEIAPFTGRSDLHIYSYAAYLD